MKWLVKGYNENDEVEEIEVEANTLVGAREAGEEVLERLRSISQMDGGVPASVSVAETFAEEDSPAAETEVGVGSTADTVDPVPPEEPEAA